MTDPSATPPFTLPDLAVLRTRVTLRLLADAHLPAYKGGMLRGGFGYAFQRAVCPQTCWGAANQCPFATICPYRWVFETPHPPGVPHLHDLQDVPRPFVIDPPADRRTSFHAGESLEFGLVIIGRGIDYLPYFLFGFAQLGQMGLGAQRVPARLERVEALQPWQHTGPVIYQDEQVLAERNALPLLDAAAIAAQARTLPDDLRIILETPVRVKRGKQYLSTLEPDALVRAMCWRLNALTIFHGDGPWSIMYRPVVEQAQAIRVDEAQVRWEDWGRTSTRGGRTQHMKLGGIVGSARLRGVPPDVRSVLLAGSLLHVGKACVFGHGAYRLLAER